MVVSASRPLKAQTKSSSGEGLSSEWSAARRQIACRVRLFVECPQCGTMGVRLIRQTGLCPLCSEELYVEEERAFNELLCCEAEGCEGGGARCREAGVRATAAVEL